MADDLYALDTSRPQITMDDLPTLALTRTSLRSERLRS
jgi:hypothetical protein